MARRATSYSPRRSAVLSSLDGAGVDGLLVTSCANVRYLTGFSGTNGWLLLAPGGCVFLTDPRYERQARAEVAGELDGLEVARGDEVARAQATGADGVDRTDAGAAGEGAAAEIQISEKGLEEGVAAALKSRAVRRPGFESSHVTVALLDKLSTAAAADWVPCDGLVEALRRAKDAEEIEAVRRALAVAEAALVEVAAAIHAGQTEAGVAAELEYACRRRGAEGIAFETIVASGPRSALPHGVASSRVIGADEPVMIDMGCRLGGYCSDITRMVWCGAEPDECWLNLHRIVDRARAAALDAVRAGIIASEVDERAREVIVAAGFGEAFTHGTGHGVGLEIHEQPTLSSRGGDRLEDGMVVTIEPAVYLPGELGIRVEDMVQVTAEGHRRLTTLGTEPILPKTP